jgi:nucleoside-diphosphate-sugar epimerase
MALVDWVKLHAEALKGRRCVVTGGAGFIGSHLVEALLVLGADVAVIDDMTGGERANLDTAIESAMRIVNRVGSDRPADRLRVIEASIEDRAACDEAIQGREVVFHQAAWGSVPRSVAMPDRYHAINVTGTFNVLEAARATKVKRIVFAASSSAYGDTPILPKVETMPVAPRSPYAANKVACEAMMRGWACSYPTHDDGSEFDTVSLRYFNIFGPRQNANSAYAAVIAAFAKALLKGERPVIFGDGEQSRDFTFVDNAVHANLRAAVCPERLQGVVLNIACGQRVSVSELASAMASMLGRPDLKPEHRDDRPGDVKHSLADVMLARQHIGYRPLVDFQQGLEATVAWYRQVLG